MSNAEREPCADGFCLEQPCDSVLRIIKPRSKDLDGFSVRRVLPNHQQRQVGPWVFFDHLGPVEFKAGSGIDVRPHPHINLATVTYLFEGEILHRDSLGSEVAIRPGDINLMVAGRGIAHSEREAESVRNHHHRLHALQLWLALPEADEECAPAFYHYPKAELPQLDRAGVPVRVMMGSAYGVTSPVRTFAPTLYLEARLSAGQGLLLAEAEQRALYVATGALQLDGQALASHDLAVLAPGEVRIEAVADSRVVLFGGAALAPRHLFWNFVSSRPERIEQAKAEWRAGRFPAVVGDDGESAPLPE